ncbi:hypothetical protein SPHINGOR109_30101 [Sphingorhabdus sp. 109]|nr:hypothetical protein SPHINGOR109_30101 [Sphingorhabdus sp. 109]
MGSFVNGVGETAQATRAAALFMAGVIDALTKIAAVKMAATAAAIWFWILLLVILASFLVQSVASQTILRRCQ